MSIKFSNRQTDLDPAQIYLAHFPCDHHPPCVGPSLEELSGSDLDDAAVKISKARVHRAHDMLVFRTRARAAARAARFQRILIGKLRAARDEFSETIVALYEQKSDIKRELEQLEQKDIEWYEGVYQDVDAFFDRLLEIIHLEYWGHTFPTMPWEDGKKAFPLIAMLKRKDPLRKSLEGKRDWMRGFANSEFLGGWDRWCVPQCYLCGEKLSDLYTEEDVEHIIPTSKGGRSEFYNLALAHKTCNNDKADMDAGDYMATRRWAKDKTNCSMCLKLLPRDELVYCTPPRWYSDRFRVLGNRDFRFCADCYPRKGAKKLCVCENPDNHIEPTFMASGEHSADP